jgi:hypothetical protein
MIRTMRASGQTVRGSRLLLALLGSPLAWTVHLLAGYFVVTLWCSAGWTSSDTALAVLTLLCAGAAIASGVLALKLWRQGQRGLRSDVEPGVPGSWDARMGERGSRGIFLAVVGLFMSGMFTYLIVLQGLPPFFTPACPATAAS